MGVKVVQSTADFQVGDVLMCPHGVLFLVTKIFDELRYESTVMFGHGDGAENHEKCAKRVEFPIRKQKGHSEGEGWQMENAQ